MVLEVSIFTALLGLGMHALGGLQIDHGDVNAPGHPGVRDYMLRYMAEIFVGGQFGPIFGQVAGWIVTGVFGFLLLSAVSTAIVDLVAISFLMSRDGELPSRFEKLNRFGVPNLGLIVATIGPAILVVVVKDIAGLAELYAIGVVGAIATNLGATSTDSKLNLARWERALMVCTFLIMAAIQGPDKIKVRGFLVIPLTGRGASFHTDKSSAKLVFGIFTSLDGFERNLTSEGLGGDLQQPLRR